MVARPANRGTPHDRATTHPRIKRLLADYPAVERWYRIEGDGRSEATKWSYLEGFELLLHDLDLTPPKFLKLAADLRKAQDLWTRYARMEGAGAKTKVMRWMAAKSYARAEGVTISFVPRLTREQAEVQDASMRRVPTMAEARQLVAVMGSVRDRAVAYWHLSTGCRVGVGAYGAHPDGIRLESLNGFDYARCEFTQKPSIVVVPSRLSKNGRSYPAPLTTETAEALEAMLKARKAAGEVLVPRSPLFIPDERGLKGKEERLTKDGHRVMSRKGLASVLSVAISKIQPADVRWTPHTMRAWASTALETAEHRGKCSRTRRELLLGHSLGVDGTYNFDRPLNPEKAAELAETVRNVEPFLTLSAVTETEMAERRRQYELLAKLVVEMKGLKMSAEAFTRLTPEQQEQLIRGDEVCRAPAEVPMPSPSERLRAVPNAQLDAYLARGWVPVSAVGTEWYLVKPTGA